ncbi:MAG: hypothetical protein JNK59_12300 [Sterolibacteriaceae bacterium]|nr:hypothetical protein [Sterolibacteriaceae bacterium]
MKSPCLQRRLLGLLLAALMGPAVAQDLAMNAPAIDLAWTTRAVAEPHRLRDDSVFGAGLPLTGFGRDRARIEQEARGRLGPVNLLATVTASGQEGAKPETTFVAHEAYVDFSLGGERFSAGRKVLSGDVGYAFRPLDVLQRESRLQLAPPPLSGIPMIAWDNFGADSAWSLILANPGHGPGSAGSTAAARDDSSLALRVFRRVANADFHGIARASARNGLELGAGFAAVPNDAVELHGSLLLQQRGERRVPLAAGATAAQLLNAGRALQVESHGRVGKALLGATWTAESGLSAMGELWWDGGANSADEWRRLRTNAVARNALRGLPGVPDLAIAGANAASTRLFEQGNLARRGLLARLAWTEPAGKWSAAADWMASLDDGGRNLTLSAGYAADKWRLDAGLRAYGGKVDSAFGLLPERRAAFVTLSASY